MLSNEVRKSWNRSISKSILQQLNNIKGCLQAKLSLTQGVPKWEKYHSRTSRWESMLRSWDHEVSSRTEKHRCHEGPSSRIEIPSHSIAWLWFRPSLKHSFQSRRSSYESRRNDYMRRSCCHTRSRDTGTSALPWLGQTPECRLEHE